MSILDKQAAKKEAESGNAAIIKQSISEIKDYIEFRLPQDFDVNVLYKGTVSSFDGDEGFKDFVIVIINNKNKSAKRFDIEHYSLEELDSIIKDSINIL